MATIVKKEYHQCIVSYEAEITLDTLSLIYPDLTEEELEEKMLLLEESDPDTLQDVIDMSGDAYDFEHTEDNMWTMHKGGYEVDFEVL